MEEEHESTYELLDIQRRLEKAVDLFGKQDVAHILRVSIGTVTRYLAGEPEKDFWVFAGRLCELDTVITFALLNFTPKGVKEYLFAYDAVLAMRPAEAIHFGEWQKVIARLLEQTDGTYR